MADIATLGLEVDAGGYIRTTEQATRSTRKLAESGDRAERNVRGIGDGADSTARSMRLLKGAVAAVATGFAGLRLAREARDAVLLSARYETLGVVMETVGRNAGRTAAEMREFQRGLEETGISAIQSRNNLARMAGAQIDFAHATDLARIAQNAAVIASTNSSEAFERLITGISTGQRRVLRTMGLFIDFESAINAYAESLGVAADDLTEFERIQARANAVLEGAGQIAGTYEAAMETAGKQVGSMVRLVDNLKVALGSVGLATFSGLVVATTDALKWANENATALADAMIALAMAVGITGAAFAFKALLPPVIAASGAFLSLIPAINSVGAAIALLHIAIGPAGWLILGITALTALIYGWRRAHRGHADQLRDIGGAARDAAGGIRKLTEAQALSAMAHIETQLANLETIRDALTAGTVGPGVGMAFGAGFGLEGVNEQIETLTGRLETLRGLLSGGGAGGGGAFEVPNVRLRQGLAGVPDKAFVDVMLGALGTPSLGGGPGIPAITTPAEGGGTGTALDVEVLRWSNALQNTLDPIRAFGGSVMDTARALRDDPLATVLAGVRGAASALWDGLKGLASGLGSILGSIASAFNPLNIIATVFNEALREAARAAKPLVDAIAPLVNIIANALQPAFEAMAPLFEALQPVVNAIATGFAGIIVALVPVFEALVPVLESAVRGFTYLLQAVGWVIKGFGWFIGLIPGLGGLGETLEDFGQGLIDAGGAARRALDDTTTATNGFTDALTAATSAIPNSVPLEYYRQVFGGGGGGTTTTPTVPGMPPGTPNPPTTASADTYHITVTEASNPRETASEVLREIVRLKGRGESVSLDRFYQPRTT